MVVFDHVSAQLSTDLCHAIPGDLSAKLTYLQQELKEHYPHVIVTHTGSHLKVHGQIQEIVDLYNVLGVWFSTRDRSKHQDAIVLHSQGLTEPSLTTNLTASNPLAPSFNIQYVNQQQTPVTLSTAALQQFNAATPNITSSASSQILAAVGTAISADTNTEQHFAPPTSVEAGTCTEPDHNTSFCSSTDDVNDDDSHNIKSFIKSWNNRRKNQEVQTDLPTTAPSPPASGRRRKPGTPRKAKAHVPLKLEKTESTRSRKKPTRFAEPIEKSTSSTKKKIGRPPKKFSLDKVLPEEMIPVESKLEPKPSDESLNITDGNILENAETSDKHKEWSLDVDEDDTEIVMEEGFSVDVNNSNASKTDAAGVSRTSDEQEVEVERRGRKHKEGPCIAREAIEKLLPSHDTHDMKCTLCTQVCKTRASLKQHYLRCHLERRFQCMVCGKRYGMLKELASHKLTHNRRHQCPNCDKKFATQFLLDGHMERKHLNPKKKVVKEQEFNNTSCKYCDFQAKTKKSLRDHVKRLHGEKNHECPVCNKKFALGKDLNQHVKFHTEVFQCDECGKALKSKLALKLHVNGIHRGIKLMKEKEYVCEDCGKICRNKTHFKEHVNKIHLHVKPFKCEDCHMAFYTKHGLKCHSTTHSETREFICDVCAKSFKSRSGLRVHRITHRDVGARPYSCSTCAKTFTQRGALVRHERIHSGARPYACRLCNAAFNDYSILRRHVVGVHKIDDRALCGRGNLDPNTINRGRPKVPGGRNAPAPTAPPPEPDTSTESTEILSKAAQVIIEAPEGSIAHTMESGTHYLVEPAQRLYQLSTPVEDHSYSEITAKALRDGVSAQPQIETVQQGGEAVELIQLSDLSPSQLVQQHQQLLHVHSQQPQGQTINVVPVSMVNSVNSIVSSTLYDGGDTTYTIGMPVFPTPTTVGSMHMMQPLQPLTHLHHSYVQQPEQQAQQHQHQQQQQQQQQQ